MKTLGTDKVTRAALILIALGIWSIFLSQVRTVAQPRDVVPMIPVVQSAEKIVPRYQLVRQSDAKIFLTDTQTGRTWGALGSSSLSSGDFMEVTPDALRPNTPQP